MVCVAMRYQVHLRHVVSHMVLSTLFRQVQPAWVGRSREFNDLEVWCVSRIPAKIEARPLGGGLSASGRLLG